MRPAVLALSVCLGSAWAIAQDPGARPVEFFEKKVRPVLVTRCGGCHGEKVRMAGFNLTRPADFFAGSGHGPIVQRGKPEASLLYSVVTYDAKVKMPPTGRLPDEEIEAIRRWIEMGAPWPKAELESAAGNPGWNPERTAHWAFQPVSDPPVPSVGAGWAVNAIDAFILKRLQQAGLRPAAPVEKLTLLRRVKFDLHGLPPEPGEIDQFLRDESPQAYARLVDRLLESPRYGERWGRHWLDVARYADSTGLDEDHRYPHAWRYRDWVIDAFNRDLPYDQFVRLQIAGDLEPPPQPGQYNPAIVATGFLALGPKPLAQQDAKRRLYDVVDEQIDTLSKALLGLTIACARCHDHKFDPISQKDYYALASIFASSRQFEDPDSHVAKLYHVPLVPRSLYEQYYADREKIRRKRQEIDVVAESGQQAYLARMQPYLAAYMIAAAEAGPRPSEVAELAAARKLQPAVLARWVDYLRQGNSEPLRRWRAATPETRPAVAATYQQEFDASAERWFKKLEQWKQSVESALRDGMTPPEKPKFSGGQDAFFAEVALADGPFSLPQAELEKELSPDVLARLRTLRKELQSLQEQAVPEPDMASAITEDKVIDQPLFLRGNHLAPGPLVAKGFPAILTKNQPAITQGSGRRELAAWLTGPDHPLTARVMVNRIWHWHFGEGLVRSPDNFGLTGDRPTHPELLDYLAREFQRQRWSVKAMHRLILLSSTYRMSSQPGAGAVEKDPGNLLWSRFRPRRLSAEEMRDAMLAVEGSLDLTMGGTLQKGTGTDRENSDERISFDPSSTYRRTVYLPLRRSNLSTALTLFDFGDATLSAGKRMETNIAPQALFLLNSPFASERARRLAARLLKPETPDRERVVELYLRAYGRRPEAGEIDDALDFVAAFEKRRGGQASARPDAWQALCRTVMASNEFHYVE